MSDLFNTDKANLGPVTFRPQPLLPLSTLNDLPEIPEIGDTPADLVRYLIASQQAAFRDHTTLSRGALLKGAKMLLNEYSPDIIKRAIQLAAKQAMHPFTWKYVRTFAIPEVIQQCGGISET